MKKLSAALLIILAVAVMSAPFAAADMFFPLNPGDVFTYSVSGQTGTGQMTVNSPVRSVGNGKSYHVLVLFNHNGPEESIEFLRSTEKAFYRYDKNGAENRIFTEGPAGMSWEERRLDGRIVRTSIEAIETVTVPAGKYTGCLKYREEQVRPQQKLYMRTWFKPGFGIVKAANYDCPRCSLTNPQIMQLTGHSSGGHVHPQKPDMKSLNR
jgi:hypothetical protein